MKQIIIGLLLVLGTVVRAEDVISEALAPYSSRGVSITLYGNAIEYTNTVKEPWFPTSIMADNGISTNTITVEVVRIHDIVFQYRPDAVTTNIFGQVETNYYGQVTNMVYRAFTGTVASVTTTGNALYAISPVFQFKADDVIKITQTDTNAKAVVISGRR
jgi:hypothetical protein